MRVNVLRWRAFRHKNARQRFALTRFSSQNAHQRLALTRFSSQKAHQRFALTRFFRIFATSLQPAASTCEHFVLGWGWHTMLSEGGLALV